MFNKVSYRRGVIEGVILYTLGRLGALIRPAYGVYLLLRRSVHFSGDRTGALHVRWHSARPCHLAILHK